jgi:ribosome-associated protein
MTEIENKTTAHTPPTEPQATSNARRRRSLRELQDDVPSNAVDRTQPERLARALEHARICARIADDNRAKDILLLDLRQATPLVDYFVMKRIGERKLGIEGSEEGRWTLIDYGDFVVHVFSAEARAYYALEEIWGDAPRLDWRDPSRPAAAGAGPEDEAVSNSQI